MRFTDDDIQHAFEDIVKFLNLTYGLDFSQSAPNERNEYIFENARMNLFTFAEDVQYRLALSNWIQTGKIRFDCRDIHIGGYQVAFTGNQILRGSYGGSSGTTVGGGVFLEYGYYMIDVCDQSPVTFRFAAATPIRQEPVDGVVSLTLDLYSHVLGYGKALGYVTLKLVSVHSSCYNH